MDTLTRRAAFTGAALTALAVATPAFAQDAKRTTVSPELLALIAAAEVAERTANHHTYHVHRPAAACNKAAIAAAEASAPHLTVDGGPSVVEGTRVVWSTEDPASVAGAQTIARMAKEGCAFDPGVVAAARKVVAAQLRRKRIIARAQLVDLSAIIARNDQLNDATSDALDEVAHFPVATATDLQAKLAFMVKRDMGDGVDWLSELLADAQRLTKREG